MRLLEPLSHESIEESPENYGIPMPDRVDLGVCDL